MLPNVKSAARGFAAVATAVGLAGLGFADEPKKEVPKPAKVIEVVRPQAADDKKADERKDADAASKQLQKLLDVVQGKGQLDDATMLEVLRLMEKRGGIDVVVLNQLMNLKDLAGVIEVRPDARAERLQLPGDFRGGGARAVPPPGDSDLRKQYEQQLKDFNEQIKKAGDAEAREQLEKTRDEYKKAMAEPLKKADAAAKDVPAARGRPDDPERGVRDQNADAMRRLVEMQRDMQRRLMEDVRRLDGPDPFGRMELFPGDPFMPDGRNAAPPRLGVKVEKVSAVLAEQLDLPNDSGIVIADVTAGSAAEKAGLKKNDVLLTLAGKDVPTDPEAFTALVGKLTAGEKLDAVVLRKGKKETVKGIELPEVKRAVRPFVNPLGGGNEQVQIQINGDDVVTLNATVDKVKYEVNGPLKNGKVSPARIVVTEGRESKEYDSLEKMPEGERATVERLLGKVRLLTR